MTLSETPATQKSGLAARIGISPEKELTFGTPGAVLGQAAPRPGERRKLLLDYQWQRVTYSCPSFKFYVDIYKLFKAQLKPDVN